MAEHPENYEDVTVYGLDDDVDHVSTGGGASRPRAS